MSSSITPTGTEAADLEAPSLLITLADRDPLAEGGPSSGLQLLRLEPSGLSVFPLPSTGVLSIGRGEDCDVRLLDPLASRRHASLHVQPLGIEDAGSVNGTYVSNALLSAGVIRALRVGDSITIGRSLLLVQRKSLERSPTTKLRRESGARTAEADAAIVIEDAAMKRLYATVDLVAKSSINVLILGETGSGKDVVAEAIHRRSPRHAAPLMRINCAALSEALLESELFGHERGAFTGAVSAKTGLIEAADGGTVFLDEVGELSHPLQAKLLRVLEAREVLRVGSLRPRSVDVRFMAATNRDLAAEIARGKFRTDLFFRLNGVCLEVPPLRERRSEILVLAQAFLSRAAGRIGAPIAPRLSVGAIDRLLEHAWPGNVRELRNEMERVAVLCPGPHVEPADLWLSRLPPQVHASAAADAARTTQAPDAPSANSAAHRPSSTANQETARGGEQIRIISALAQSNGNQTRAAKLLGMPRRTFVAKLSLYDIPRPRKG